MAPLSGIEDERLLEKFRDLSDGKKKKVIYFLYFFVVGEEGRGWIDFRFGPSTSQRRKASPIFPRKTMPALSATLEPKDASGY